VIVPVLQLLFPTDFTENERDLLVAALEDYGLIAVHEIADREWRAFFRTGAERDAACLAVGGGSRAAATLLDLPDEDWARRSQEALRAIAVGNLIIAPPWDIPKAEGRRPEAESPEARAIVIVIEPSMGFGTGHHATTRLCLRALQRVPVRERSVLDVGTGSGVLAIAAAVLGAAPVVAIDNDPDAIEAASANARRNGVAIGFRLSGLTPGVPHADIVLANLTGAVLRRHAATLARLARRTLIVSGVLSDESAELRRTFSTAASAIEQDEEDGWMSFTLTIP
jgi:ribosomal protein L11 methyltransferase